MIDLDNLGYVLLGLLSFGGSSFALIGAGVLSATGKLNIGTSLLIAITFNYLGDVLIFYYAKFLKKYFKNPLYGFINKHKRKVAYTRALIHKKGNLGMFIQKYIYLVKTIYPIMLGILNYDNKKFLFYNLLASITWGLSLGFGSYFFSDFVRRFI